MTRAVQLRKVTESSPVTGWWDSARYDRSGLGDICDVLPLSTVFVLWNGLVSP